MEGKTQNTAPLSPREKTVLEFLETYARLHGFAPTYQEICTHFGFASFNSAQRYLKQLEGKGYIQLGGSNQKRSIRLVQSSSAYQDTVEERERSQITPSSNAVPLPLLGRVAAGAPLEAFEHDEFIDVPASLVKRPEKTYALRVQGQSMIEDGILDGDVILVERQSRAENGEIVVAVVPGSTGQEEATVKRFFQSRTRRESATRQGAAPGDEFKIELRPANSTMKSLWFNPGEVQVRGIVVGLLRKFW